MMGMQIDEARRRKKHTPQNQRILFCLRNCFSIKVFLDIFFMLKNIFNEKIYIKKGIFYDKLIIYIYFAMKKNNSFCTN